MPMIVAEKLTKYYGDKVAIKDVGFSIEHGEVVGLLGLNGAGKTTTLKMLSGALLGTSGRILIDGLDMASEPEAARSRLGFLPETPPLYPEMTVESFLRFVARIKGFKGDYDAAIEDAMKATDLLDRRYDRIDTLSHGYRRRVGIAHAIVNRPALILLDEPTSGLDPRQVVQMRKLIRDLRQKHTILVSSHILSEITQLCDRILVLEKGQLAAEGTEEDLAQRMGTGMRVQLEVRGEQKTVKETLAAVPSVTEVTIDKEDDGVVHVSIQLADDTREDVAKALIDGGFGIRRLERVQLQLESIFLQLTGAPSDAGSPPSDERPSKAAS